MAKKKIDETGAESEELAVGDRVTLEGTIEELHGDRARIAIDRGAAIVKFAALKKVVAAGLLVLALLLGVSSARAGEVILFDNPALAQHPTILHFGGLAGNQTSITFAGGYKQAVFAMDLQTCTACNVNFQLFAVDPTGNSKDLLWCNDPTAATATGTYIYTVGPGTDAVNASAGTAAPFGIRLNCNRPLPPQFYVKLVMTGTNFAVSMRGYAWNY